MRQMSVRALGHRSQEAATRWNPDCEQQAAVIRCGNDQPPLFLTRNRSLWIYGIFPPYLNVASSMILIKVFMILMSTFADCSR